MRSDFGQNEAHFHCRSSYVRSKSINTLVSNRRRRKKEISPKAQTMCLASFGPYFVVTASFLIHISYVRPKKTIHYLVTQRDERKKNAYLWPKLVWAHFRVVACTFVNNPSAYVDRPLCTVLSILLQ